MKTVIKPCLTFLALLLILSGCSSLKQNSSDSIKASALEKIQLGDKEQSVIGAIGSPSKIHEDNENYLWVYISSDGTKSYQRATISVSKTSKKVTSKHIIFDKRDDSFSRRILNVEQKYNIKLSKVDRPWCNHSAPIHIPYVDRKNGVIASFLPHKNTIASISWTSPQDDYFQQIHKCPLIN